MKYRAEIDGLRAIAVVPVILFHAGFEAFSGGYVGVDVFFVISGYLITTILIEDIDNDQFSIVSFYERRARRILPALFVVLIACTAFAVALLGPTDLEDFGLSVVGSSLFFNNVVAWRLTGGYFSAEAELMPLLHLWSLGVEEQFYIVFPILLFLCARFLPGRIALALLAISLVSFATAVWGAIFEPSANFYLTPTRVWELFAGAMTALLVRRASGNPRLEWLGFAGLAMIVASVFAMDGATPFPSYPTILPVLGTVLILAFANSASLVGRVLGNKVFVFAGLISYSAYLWHQPIFAFFRSFKMNLMPAPAEKALLLGCVLALAYPTWKYVEQPFRRKDRFSKGRIFALSLLVILAPTLFGAYLISSDGLAGRTSGFKMLSAIIDAEKTVSQLHSVKCKDVVGASVRVCGDTAAPRIALFGDSHAEMLSRGMLMNGTAHFMSSSAGCPPLIEIDVKLGNHPEGACEALTEKQVKFVRDSKDLDAVILVGRWSYYTTGDYGEAMRGYFLTDKESDAATEAGSRTVFKRALKRTVDAYRKSGVRVFVVLQAPQQKLNVLRSLENLYVRGYSNTEMRDLLYVNANEHLALQEFNRREFRRQKETSAFRIVELDDLFCGQDGRCPTVGDNMIRYKDQDHLSVVGAKRAAAKIAAAVKNLE